MLLGHPGKLAKLAVGQWDTHSSRSGAAAESVGRLHRESCGRPAATSPTVEGIFAALEPADRTMLAERLADDVRQARDPAAGEPRGRRRHRRRRLPGGHGRRMPRHGRRLDAMADKPCTHCHRRLRPGLGGVSYRGGPAGGRRRRRDGRQPPAAGTVRPEQLPARGRRGRRRGGAGGDRRSIGPPGGGSPCWSAAIRACSASPGRSANTSAGTIAGSFRASAPCRRPSPGWAWTGRTPGSSAPTAGRRNSTAEELPELRQAGHSRRHGRSAAVDRLGGRRPGGHARRLLVREPDARRRAHPGDDAAAIGRRRAMSRRSGWRS